MAHMGRNLSQMAQGTAHWAHLLYGGQMGGCFGDRAMSDMETQFYKLVRCYFSGDKIELDTGLTLEEAQEWCADPETSDRTCEGAVAKERSIARGPWFDAYYKE